MAYAIARVKKLKRANIAGSAAHTSRQRETPNADPAKQNIRFIGNTDREEKLEDLVLAKIGQYEQKRKIRTDAVYCVEILLTASPSYFRPLDPSAAGYYEEERLADWLSATQQWLEKEYGDCAERTAVGDRIVRAELHLDEVTPHIHAYFVPLDENGQLRCNHFFDGRQKMRDFQESYFAAVQHLGLERGIRGSVAKHQDIKDFYRIVEEGKDLNSELTIAQMRAKAADRDRAVQSKSSMERTAKRLVQENETLRQRIKELEAQKEQLQQQVEQLSDLPLEDVAWHLGFDPDNSSDVGHTVVSGDKVKSSTLKGNDAESSVQGNRLRRSVAERTKRTAIGSYRCFLGGEHIIYINGSQWSHLAPDTQKTGAIAGAVNTQKTRASAANAQKIGNVTANTQTTSVSPDAITGTGAVALVKHINGCNFREAIAWLNDRFGEEGMQRAVTHYARQQAQMVIQEQEEPQFVPPVPDKSNWHLVHDYLTKKRRLPTELVQELYQRGWVYADDQENAVFLLRNLNGETKGAFLQGTRAEDNTFTGYAIGTKRSEGWFYLQWGGQPTDEIQKVVLLKSPLDVLSFAMLEVERHRGVPGGVPEERTMYMTVDSPRSLPVDLLQDIPEVVCAYDNDSAGDEMAGVVGELLPQATRVKPQAQNWHEESLVLLRWQQREREYQQQRQKQQRQRERKRESELEL
ncbi:plasmid recombination protein [Anabaena sphaerica FACHB-251]|uniref:Plasmid recombination protein n=1 Tax=Anabaena sphaerica FACHB-251 TaxID=2692883 RepID=A0A926WMF3_9NOST|nr:MobV family relaxase [Anabaena sphaerica]MBD2296822.1 plasmid recombination protein [Anabaena sphaerica FACHB-251]